ncbi:MAG: L-serine ammonia-lyase, iron-sulfur-dependent, subunit alpha, partial [Clostridia bacterium]|nr:L-serine ammonia-lyase, iron-sulfur-dependent, subunit alpha [Clostridia bacterium]
MDITSIAYLLEETAKSGQPIWQIVLREEQSDSGDSQESILERAMATYEVMKNAAISGIASDMKSVSGLTGGDAARYYNYLRDHKSLLGAMESRAVAYALGTSGYNAAMGVVVACPTAGAAGIVPGVLIAAQEEYGFSDREAVSGLLTASGIGGVVATRAT